MNKDGYEICKICKGKKENIIYFKYKGKEFHYYEKCGYCYASGKIDWVKKARGRKPGIEGMFCDSHPAGSMFIDGTEDQIMGGSSVYDGHEYIKTDTERGTALWYELISRHNEEDEDK